MYHHYLLLVLLTLVVGCVADNDVYWVRVQLTPRLYDDHHYYVQATCSSTNINTTAFSVSREKNDLADLKIGDKSRRCPGKYQIAVGIFYNNDNDQKKLEWSTWLAPHTSQSATFEEGKNVVINLIKFGNYFKLNILPNLAETFNSKMLYRVNVYCAGKERVEFKTYTQSKTMVVFNTVLSKCEQYDVKVWPIRKEWMQIENTFGEPVLAHEGIRVKNGATYQINFTNHFNLAISPPLAPNVGQVYYAEVKCHGREAETFRTYTEANAQIVLNAIECTEFDISVWKLDNQMVQNAQQLFPIEEQNLSNEFAVIIENDGTYQFNYIEEHSVEIADHLMDIEYGVQEQPLKKKLKQMSADIVDLCETTATIKRDVEGIRNELSTTMSELNEFFAQKFK
ncbi:hypothetical protein GPALN_005882 [Globodera pallida]|nr:hypothetical protein GPALN_005882 [Globodera pallida]